MIFFIVFLCAGIALLIDRFLPSPFYEYESNNIALEWWNLQNAIWLVK